jgi:hypothetical protein
VNPIYKALTQVMDLKMTLPQTERSGYVKQQNVTVDMAPFLLNSSDVQLSLHSMISCNTQVGNVLRENTQLMKDL